MDFAEKRLYRMHEGQGVYTEYYTKISKEEFQTYREGLLAEGYELEEQHQWGMTRFYTYMKKKDVIFLAYYEKIGEMNVVTEPNSNWISYADQRGEDKVANLLRQIDLEDFGESYVLRLRDGRMLVFDGGFEYEADADSLMHTLDEFAQGEKPCIAAWIMTHPHLDHYRCFLLFYEKYGERVEIEKFIYNFPDVGKEELEAIPALCANEETKHIQRLYDAVAKTGATVYRAHTGQMYQVGNAKMEILSSPDNTMEPPIKNFNQNSLVIRMEIEGQVILWGGDSHFEKIRFAERFGEYLKSDIFQIPHHGFQGGDIAAYNLIDPSVCLVASFERVWLGTDFKFFGFEHNQHLIYEMDIQEYLAGGNGDITLELPYVPKENRKKELLDRIVKWRNHIPFRTDEYGKNFYIEDENGLTLIPYRQGEFQEQGIEFYVEETMRDDVLKIVIRMKSEEELACKRLGFRLGIDTYMDKYPDWDNKFFPSALRCEKQGFWSCFMSPLGEIVSVCSPSRIVSWKHEYARAGIDVGHRIYTSSVDFINTYENPQRHPGSRETLDTEPVCIELYFACPKTEEDMYQFIEKYAHIKVPKVSKHTLEPGERVWIDGEEWNGELKDGLNYIRREDSAEVTVFQRKDWFYYLDCARKSAEKCQQKPGTHCESWYGFFSRVLYATVIKNAEYTKRLCDEFKAFFEILTQRVEGVVQMREEALPYRLQNVSAMISLLADFYELTGEKTYLDDANDFADFLMSLQDADGSYRKENIHYTCVIYPAKSMLELAILEKEAGLKERYERHYASAYRAIKNLEVLLDNIETEGQMTFEDGMISCESLQLGYLAMLLPEGEEKERLAQAAELVLKKHRCLEQQFIPDCRIRGCTARFWEARYDLNFFANMMNTPHGWTSWKNYATFYLYMLTGKEEYLRDTMDTMGACMQCVDENGKLHWGFVVDPCIVGERLKKGSEKGNIQTETAIVGECYLPMISDWWRQSADELVKQYLSPINKPSRWDAQYGGSCDNDVHEHFKCLVETVFGRAFIHETEEGFLTYNCRKNGEEFVCEDPHLYEWIVYVNEPKTLVLNGKKISAKKGIHTYPL